jgi:hypothetical protein
VDFHRLCVYMGLECIERVLQIRECERHCIPP